MWLIYLKFFFLSNMQIFAKGISVNVIKPFDCLIGGDMRKSWL